MLTLCLLTLALAGDDPPSGDPQPDFDREALLREAEALAAESPPPVQPPHTRGANALNPRLTAFGDMLTTIGIENGAVLPESGPWLRSLELDIRADVDPYAKAVAILALHQDNPIGGHEEHGAAADPHDDHDPHTLFHAVPEEVYVDFIAFPAGFSLRAGQFRQAVGITNRAHPHDWPWPDAPAPMEHFLGEEGYADVGMVLNWLAPTSATGLSFSGGAVRGSLLDPRERTAVPQWIGRGEWFHEVGQVDLAIGGSGTGLEDRLVVGSDLMFRWAPGRMNSVMVLAELLSDTADYGTYAALQVQVARPLYLGVRGDLAEEETQLGAYASWYTSEFLRVRAGSTIGAERIVAHAQLTFVWGAHPVEPYWVNR